MRRANKTNAVLLSEVSPKILVCLLFFSPPFRATTSLQILHTAFRLSVEKNTDRFWRRLSALLRATRELVRGPLALINHSASSSSPRVGFLRRTCLVSGDASTRRDPAASAALPAEGASRRHDGRQLLSRKIPPGDCVKHE